MLVTLHPAISPRLIQRTITDEDLAGLNRDADVALVTPLRDGMNLSGKEFVACRIQVSYSC